MMERSSVSQVRASFVLLFLVWSVGSVTSLDVAKEKTKANHCYDLGARRECLFLSVNWLSENSFAQQFCSVHGGSLISIHSYQMQKVVEIQARVSQLTWYVRTGAQLKHSPGIWYWKKHWPYFNVNKVLNQSSSADYRTHAAIRQVEQWRNGVRVLDTEVSARHPSDELPFICQYSAETTSCGDPDSSVLIGSSCYIQHSTTTATWYQARNKCLAENGDLAVFDDFDQLSKTRILLQSSPHWILLRNSHWQWPSGGEMLYSNWGHGQPTGIQKTCMVLDFRDPWKWMPYDCVERLTFICQKDQARLPLCSDWSCVYFIILILSISTAVLWHYYKRRRFM